MYERLLLCTVLPVNKFKTSEAPNLNIDSQESLNAKFFELEEWLKF